MKKFLSSIMESGTPKQRKQKAFAVTAILITAALIALALILCLIFALVDGFSAPPPVEEEGGDSTTGVGRDLVTTEFDEDQLYRGDLIVVDDTYMYNAEANAELELISIQNGRPTANGKNLYSSNALMSYVQKDALDALNEMTLAFYEASGIAAEDYDIWVCLGTGGSTTGIYAAGNTFELRYTTGEAGAEKPAISDNDSYKWIFQNAYKYGFIQLYAANDPNAAEGTPSQTHIFRYIGVEHAALAKDAKCTTLDAYLTYLRENATAAKPKSVSIQVTGEDGKTSKVTYKIFYQAQDAETFYRADPEKFINTVSGDNMSGYIVSYCPIAK